MRWRLGAAAALALTLPTASSGADVQTISGILTWRPSLRTTWGGATA